MKNFLEHNRNIIIVVILCIIGFAVFKFFSSPNIVTTPIDDTVAAAGKDVVDLSSSLKQVTLDRTLFGVPAYNALKDFSTDIPSQPVGRGNPFAPIGADGGVVAPVAPAKTK